MKVIPGEGLKKILKIKQKKYDENLGGMSKTANRINPWTDVVVDVSTQSTPEKGNEIYSFCIPVL